jgi:hypothetical protein
MPVSIIAEEVKTMDNKKVTMTLEIRQAGKQGHTHGAMALTKYRLLVFGSSHEAHDEAFGEAYIPLEIIKEKGFPVSITLNFE